MNFVAYNQTASPLSYAAATVVVPANGSLIITTDLIFSFLIDPNTMTDILAGNLNVGNDITQFTQQAALDYIKNYDLTSQQKDSDGAPLSRVKAAPTGWTYQQRGFEFQTSTIGSIVNNDYLNNPLSDATMKLYDNMGTLITDPATALTSCVKTVIDLVPPYDFYLIAGDAVCLVPPSDDVYISVVVAPDYPAPIGSKVVIQNINMKYVATGDKISANGRAGKGLLYNNPAPGSNKIRFIVYHSAGEVLSFGIQLETYRA